MCGITAIVKSTEFFCEPSVLHRMNEAVYHRGPDGEGAAFFTTGNLGLVQQPNRTSQWQVGLAHRRLSILDLTNAGKQPMSYDNGNFFLIFNGEIYNYLELKQELKKAGCRFSSTGDTEVILAAYRVWGTEAFRRLRGMWAIIILDLREKKLIISRDRLGIKPLYIYRQPEFLAFASEIKQFLSIPGFNSQADAIQVKNYLLTGFEEINRTFFSGVQELSPGTWAYLSIDDVSLSSNHSYWDPEKIIPTITDEKLAGELFSSVFKESVDIHLRSDVPVGCELSGGLDSSAIVTVMDKIRSSKHSIHTFTTSFPGFEHDEKEYVDAVLNTVTAQPHFDTPSPTNLRDEFSDFIYQHDEPVGSLSMYANYSLARIIQQNDIKVVLNGQGGDELLGGYWQSYFSYVQRQVKQGRFDVLFKHLIGSVLPSGNEQLLQMAPRIYQRYKSRRDHKASIPLKLPISDNGKGMISRYLDLSENERRVFDIRQLILPRLLKWDDRNLMSFSVEGRYPLLDHKLIELCLSFNTDVLFNKGWTKWPLRRAVKGCLTPKVLNRKSKIGYVTPQEQWLAKDLKDFYRSWQNGLDNPVWDVIEPKTLMSISSRFWKQTKLASAKKGQQNELGQILFRAHTLDTWMRRFNVDSFS